MDFHLKQWREYQNHSKQEQHHSLSAKFPRFTIHYNNYYNNNNTQNQYEQEESALPLPLFLQDQPTSNTTNLTTSCLPDSATSTATKYPRMGGYLSLSQWQELELQGLIYRHMLAASPIPPQLLLLLNKSLVASSPYYLPNNIQHYPYFHQSMLQSGYWGRGAMDPEAGRCRRTDGKKWRCSRDIVPGHKYCERHVHRGRNRSRKPVESPTSTSASPGGNAGGGIENANVTLATMAAASGGMAHCSLLRPSSSLVSFQLNERSSSEPTNALNNPFESQSGDYPTDGKSSARILLRFIDDWPKSLQESDNVECNISSVTSTPNLSISTPGNPSSDFSLKLSTGSNVEDTDNLSHSTERDQLQSQWNVPPWGANQVASMGGPLAEALRPSTNSSPTSVLFQLPGGTRSHASFVISS